VVFAFQAVIPMMVTIGSWFVRQGVHSWGPNSTNWIVERIHRGIFTPHARVASSESNQFEPISAVPAFAEALETVALVNLIPSNVLERLKTGYERAVASAIRCYPDLQNDEDSITGALSMAIRDSVAGMEGGFLWKTTLKKIRGRGPGALEKPSGADLAIELEVETEGGIRRKTLFAQSKNAWVGKEPRLRVQAERLATLPGQAIVIDYTATRFRAISVDEALRAEGNVRDVDQSKFRDLADVLSSEFLECTVGTELVHYDAANDRLLVMEGGNLVARPFALITRVRTTVKPRKTGSRKAKSAKARQRRKA
jgi:hypothetical protein